MPFQTVQAALRRGSNPSSCAASGARTPSFRYSTTTRQEANPVGEVWVTGNECRFAGGVFAGKTLGKIWPELPAEWTGERGCAVWRASRCL